MVTEQLNGGWRRRLVTEINVSSCTYPLLDLQIILYKIRVRETEKHFNNNSFDTTAFSSLYQVIFLRIYLPLE